MLLCDVRDRVHGIDAPTSVRPCRRDHQPRPQAGARIGGDRPVEGIGVHPIARVHRHVADDRRSEAGDAQRLVHGMVHVRREVDRRSLDVAPRSPRVARGDDADEIGDAAAGGEVADRRRRIADERGHPVEQHVLHPDRTRRGEEDAGVFVGDVGEEVAERGVDDAAARDVAEVSRRGRIDAGPIDVIGDERQQILDRRRLVGNRRVVDAAAAILGRHVDRPVAERVEKRVGVVDDRAEQRGPLGRTGLQSPGEGFEGSETFDHGEGRGVDRGLRSCDRAAASAAAGCPTDRGPSRTCHPSRWSAGRRLASRPRRGAAPVRRRRRRR